MKKEWKQLSRAERIAAIRKGVKDGLSTSKIAKRIGGCTRNAVIGLAHRAKIKLNSREALQPPEPLEEKPKEQRGPKADRRRAEKTLSPPPPAKVEPPPRKVAERPAIEERQTARRPTPEEAQPEPICELPDEAYRVHLLDVTSGHCRAPLWGDDRKPGIAAYMFCGKPVASESSYCPNCKKKMTLGCPQPVTNFLPEPRFQRVAR